MPAHYVSYAYTVLRSRCTAGDVTIYSRRYSAYISRIRLTNSRVRDKLLQDMTTRAPEIRGR
jgi:hypothetical protein